METGLKKIAVIGAGFGGLSASMILAHKGFDVTVYEKNSGPGGKADEFRQGGFRFDTGPSLFTMPHVFRELFEKSGLNFDNHVEIEPLDEICRYFFSDGKKFSAWSDVNKFAEEAYKVFGVEKKKIEGYFKRSKEMHDISAPIFLFGNPTELDTLRKNASLKVLFSIWKLSFLSTLHDFNLSRTKEPHMAQLFDRYATYTGSSPYLAPATLAIVPHVEYSGGSWLVKDGIYSLTTAMYEHGKKLGVKFVFNAEVKKILMENSAAKGVQIFDKTEEYDAVLSNSDVTYSYENMIEESSSSAKKYSRLEPSLSGVVFYWGIKGANPELAHNNILFSSDYKDEFEVIFKRGEITDDPTVYINITSKSVLEDAPENCENWFVLINAPWDNGQDWEKIVKELKVKVIQKIRDKVGIDISERIIEEKVITPKYIYDWTFSNKGSIYGVSSNSKYAAFFRQRARSKEFKNLYFCGGSAHPGGGMPLAVLSGMQAAEKIIKDNS